MEERRKYPFEVTITPQELDRGRHWVTVQLRNTSTEYLSNLRATLFTYNSHNVDVLPSGSFHFVKELRSQAAMALHFQVFANRSGRVHLRVTAYRDGSLVSWNSPDQDLRVIEAPAEIQIFFANRPNWAFEETIETETVVRAHNDVSGLRLEIAARPPSKAHTLMDIIDIDFIAAGGTKRCVSELYAGEQGTYLLSARLLHQEKLISSKQASCYVALFEE